MPFAAVLASLAVGAIFIMAVGRNPVQVYWAMLADTFGSMYGVGQVLFKATPLIFTGLSVALAFRTGLFNIGAEGQLYLGSLATAWAGVALSGLPAFLLVPACVLAGFLAGGIWGAIPGLLKAKLGVHEVINTIMMNFIALALCNYVVQIIAVSETVHTNPIAAAARIPRLSALMPSFAASPVNLSLLLALAAGVGVWWLLWKTPLGYELRAVGLNPHAARYAGISVEFSTVASMGLAGGLAGLTGVNFVLGYKGYFEQGFSEGIGFMGIAVALLGRNHPAGIVLAALLFGTLSEGRLAINATGVPKELVEILQAIIIIFVVVSSTVFEEYLVRLRRRDDLQVAQAA